MTRVVVAGKRKKKPVPKDPAKVKKKRNTAKNRTGMENPYAYHCLPDTPLYGTILYIDGGSSYLGYSIYSVTPGMSMDRIRPTDYGTIYTLEKDRTSLPALYNRAKATVDLADEFNAEAIVMESYTFIPGKSSGIFIVPSLLAFIMAEWSNRRGVPNAFYFVPPSHWKAAICGNGNAGKDIVRENGIVHFLPPDVMAEIHTRYNEKRASVEKKIGKKIITEYGEQDCMDSLSMGMYVSRRSLMLEKTRDLF